MAIRPYTSGKITPLHCRKDRAPTGICGLLAEKIAVKAIFQEVDEDIVSFCCDHVCPPQPEHKSIAIGLCICHSLI